MRTRRLCKLSLILLGNHALWTVPATQNTRVVQDIDTGLNKQLSHLRGSQSRVVFQQGRKQLHSLDRRKCSSAAEARSGRVVAAGAAAEANGEVGENPNSRQTYRFSARFLPSSRGEKKNPTLVCSRSSRDVRRAPPPPVLLLLPPDRISCT